MTELAIASLPYTSPAPETAHGLLYAPTTDLLGWLFGFLLAIGALCVLSASRDTLEALRRPWVAFWRALHAPLAVQWLFALGCCYGLVAPHWIADWPPVEQDARKPENWRYGHRGFMQPYRT